MFRFLHAADIHLDSPLCGLPLYPGATVDSLSSPTREAFSNLVDRAIQKKVAFVIIAGDLYDGNWKDFNTGIFFAAAMGRLREAGIRVVLLRGNHDAESQITRTLTLPDNVHSFSAEKAETIRFDDLRVALHGHSYQHRETVGNLVHGYPAPEPGLLNIGVLHTALQGHPDHARYAPCSLDELKSKGYAYWALGHVHERKVLNEDPHIVFPGNLQGRNIRETGAKGAVLVSSEDGLITDVKWVDCNVVRWARVKVDATGVSSLTRILERVREGIERAVRAETDGAELAARVTVSGRTPAHGMILRDEEHFRAEIRAIAAGLGSDAPRVEKIEIDTEPELDPALIRERQDAVGELQRLLDEAPGDDALVEEIRRELEAMLGGLPSEVRSAIELEVAVSITAGWVRNRIRKVAPFLVARMTSPGGEQ